MSTDAQLPELSPRLIGLLNDYVPLNFRMQMMEAMQAYARAAIEAYRTSREGEAVAPYWLIECGHSLSLGWWTGTGALKCVLFSPDPTLARRFATREAAEAEISAHGNSCMIVTEHLDVATHPADQTQAEQAAMYRELRRGQRWSVINGIGDVLRAEELDAAIRAAIKGDAS